ncbi:enoyl-CoA hydratase/isomerase family protein [uncultured Paracoccus sp.]|uniref:enoyl-CoA hydratase/isomerase family protein n=1 Tax=uncultured Paracoccus sp. TaxID=189685 RepID=UPI00261E2E57|nr:enoyl-CoA hydratase/isomerase family protein [uncultured Paracoccus sp.]
MIQVDDQGSGVVTLTLDRADKANALTAEMLDSLTTAAATVGRSDARALILTGRGPVFSAGADLDAARAGLATSDEWERLSGTIAELPVLTIAALNGTVVGGAFGMVLACDLRVAVPTARFFYPVMKLGFLPQPSDPERLVALVGPARAAMILMAGQRIDADEALAWGLIDRIAEPAALLDIARDLCRDVLGAGRDHVQRIKEMIGRR